MNDRKIKATIVRILESEGFCVHQIPEDVTQTSPDLLAVKEQSYLIEIKAKRDDPEQVRELDRTLSQGEIVSSAMPFTYQNTMSKRIRNGARRQLAPFRTAAHDFSILWLLAIGYDRNAQVEQFLATLFGTTYVKGFDRGGLTRCYYFHESEFFRAKGHLDGAIVSEERDDGIRSSLCVNTYSPRLAEFRCSTLASIFVPDSIVDPLELESRGEAYIADCDEDRKDEQAVLRYLGEKYNRGPLMKMDIGSFHHFFPVAESDDT